jgi:hypothetical protein
MRHLVFLHGLIQADTLGLCAVLCLETPSAGRFYARHRNCRFEHGGPIGVSGLGYVTYEQCVSGCGVWPKKLYQNTGYPLAPPW